MSPWLLRVWLGIIPLCLELLVDFPLGVVADDSDVDEAAQIELLRPKHGHFDGVAELNVASLAALTFNGGRW